MMLSTLYLPTIFKEISSFEVLNLMDREWEELWNKIKAVVKDEKWKETAKEQETEEIGCQKR